MSLAHALSAARRDTPGCRAAGYVDLRTRMTLLFDSGERAPRERVDALGRAAAALLRLAGADGEPAARAWVAGPDEALLAYRPEGRPGYGAFFVVAPGPAAPAGAAPSGAAPGLAALDAALAARADTL